MKKNIQKLYKLCILGDYSVNNLYFKDRYFLGRLTWSTNNSQSKLIESHRFNKLNVHQFQQFDDDMKSNFSWLYVIQYTALQHYK